VPAVPSWVVPSGLSQYWGIFEQLGTRCGRGSIYKASVQAESTAGFIGELRTDGTARTSSSHGRAAGQRATTRERRPDSACVARAGSTATLTGPATTQRSAGASCAHVTWSFTAHGGPSKIAGASRCAKFHRTTLRGHQRLEARPRRIPEGLAKRLAKVRVQPLGFAGG
jgi:hypothetical protein